MAVPLAVLVGVTKPQVGEQGAPACVSFQVTPMFVESFCTVAVNCAVAPTATAAVPGATETVIARTATVTVIVAEAAFDVSASEVAVIVTVKPPDGGLAGAV